MFYQYLRLIPAYHAFDAWPGLQFRFDFAMIEKKKEKYIKKKHKTQSDKRIDNLTSCCNLSLFQKEVRNNYQELYLK